MRDSRERNIVIIGQPDSSCLPAHTSKPATCAQTKAKADPVAGAQHEAGREHQVGAWQAPAENTHVAPLTQPAKVTAEVKKLSIRCRLPRLATGRLAPSALGGAGAGAPCNYNNWLAICMITVCTHRKGQSRALICRSVMHSLQVALAQIRAYKH